WLIAATVGIIILVGSATTHVIAGGLLEPGPALAIASLVSLPLIGSVLWGSIDALEAARQRVAESEHRFHLIVEDAPNAMLMVDETFVLAAIIDITARKQVQENQQLIIGELQHRTRNLLAVVEAITSRSLDEAKTTAEVKYVVKGRLQALAGAYAMLADAAWE